MTTSERDSLLMELGGVLWGDNKTRSNGLRSKVKDHEARLDTIESIACDAGDKIDAHLEAHKSMDQATQTLKTAALQVRGAVIAAGISALASIAVAIIMVVSR